MTVVAITGNGSFYSAGNDLSAFLTAEDPFERLKKARPILREIIRAFYTFPKLLICVVNGPCIGIAATTTVLCDVIYASDTVNLIYRFLFGERKNCNWDFFFCLLNFAGIFSHTIHVVGFVR